MQKGWDSMNSNQPMNSCNEQSSSQQELQNDQQLIQMLQQANYGNLNVDPSKQMQFYNSRYPDGVATSSTPPTIMDNKIQMFPNSNQFIESPNSFQMLYRPFLRAEHFQDSMIPVENMMAAYQNNQFIQPPQPQQQQQPQQLQQTYMPYSSSTLSYPATSPTTPIQSNSMSGNIFPRTFFTNTKTQKTDLFPNDAVLGVGNLKRSRHSSMNPSDKKNKNDSNQTLRTSPYQSNQTDIQSANKSSNLHLHPTSNSSSRQKSSNRQSSKTMNALSTVVIPEDTSSLEDFLQQSSEDTPLNFSSLTSIPTTKNTSYMVTETVGKSNESVSAGGKTSDGSKINMDKETSKRYNNTIHALEKAGLLDITLQTADLINKNSALQKDIDMLEEVVKVTKHLMGDI